MLNEQPTASTTFGRPGFIQNREAIMISEGKEVFASATAHAVQDEDVINGIAKYHSNISTALGAIQELDGLLGNKVLGASLHLAAKFAHADVKGEPRPASMLVRLLPSKFKSYIDFASDMVGLSVQVGLLPAEKLQEIASSEDAAHKLVADFKAIFTTEQDVQH